MQQQEEKDQPDGLQAVIFDFDGVICATVEYHYRAWDRLAREYGLAFSREVNDQLRGLTRRSSLDVILGGKEFSEDDIKKMLHQKNEYYLDAMEEMTQGDLLPGVLDLLKELREKSVKVGVASASRNAHRTLAHVGILDLIHAVGDGNAVRRSKPEPDVYLYVAGALAVDPRVCLAIEDSEAGVEAAVRAGMCTIGLGPAKRVGEAHVVLPGLEGVHLRDLEKIYRSWVLGKTQNPNSLLAFSEEEAH